MTYVLYIVNIMASDDMAPCVARVSATMVITMLDRIHSVPTRRVLLRNGPDEIGSSHIHNILHMNGNDLFDIEARTLWLSM